MDMTLKQHANVIADLGTYTKTDGSQGTLGDTAQLGDINFRENTFYSQFTDSVPLTSEAEALPNMQGSGQVRQEGNPQPELRRLGGIPKSAYRLAA